MTTNTKTAHTPWRLEWVEPGEAWIRDPSGRIVASVSLDDAAQSTVGADVVVTGKGDAARKRARAIAAKA